MVQWWRPLANTENNSCEYSQDGYDCNSNCILELDCNGVCGGEATTGDLNFDGFIDDNDGQEYINQIINNDITPTNCTDLDSDTSYAISSIILSLFFKRILNVRGINLAKLSTRS